MKEDLTRRTLRCQNPACGKYFIPLDDNGYCEECTPQTLYARGAGYWPTKETLDLGDCEDEP